MAKKAARNGGERVCACGCGRTLAGRRPAAKFYGNACRQRAFQGRGVSALKRQPETPVDGPTDAGTAYELARARKEAANAKLAELELEQKRGDLVPAKDVRAEMERRAVAARTKFEGIPAGFRQRHPEATDAQVMTLDDLVRQALEEFSREEADPGDGA